MKKMITLFTALLIVGAMNAQSIITTEFSDYETNENYTRVSISKKMFEIIANLDPDDIFKFFNLNILEIKLYRF